MVTGDECLELMQVVAAKIQSQATQMTTCECGDFDNFNYFFAYKSDSFLYSLHLVMSERNNALATIDQMRELIQKCWLSVFPEKYKSLLISLHLVKSERDNALAAADQMHQQHCRSSIFPESCLFD